MLSEEEIKILLKRARLFDRLRIESGMAADAPLPEEYQHLMELADELDISREALHEALTEHQQVPIQDPIPVNTGSNNRLEVLGFARGRLTPDALRELKASAEYFFKQNGRMTTRNNKGIWRAMPDGFKSIFSVYKSPKVMFEQSGDLISIKAQRNVKSYNNFYPISLFFGFASVMIITVLLFGEVDDSGAAVPLTILSAMSAGISFFVHKMIRRRKEKHRERLFELVEVLQQTLERKFKAKMTFTKTKPQIEIEDEQLDLEEIEHLSVQAVKAKH
ncbi:MAG: hypothetical protein AAFW89_08220 [Bacteroidota bacterium]